LPQRPIDTELSRRRFSFARDLLLVIGMALVAGFAFAGGTDSSSIQEPGHLTFHIPAQPLVTALRSYSEVSGVQVLYESRLAAGIRSPGVEGDFTAEAALRALLAGTELTVHYTRANAITITRAIREIGNEPPRYPLAPADLSLDTLRVTPSEASPDQSDLTQYTGVVQADIQNALQRNSRTRSGDYHAGIKLWVTASRTVERIELFRSSGDRQRDAAISQALQRLVISAAAPTSVAQPINVVITVRSP
jgi:hypothetical protein